MAVLAHKRPVTTLPTWVKENIYWRSTLHVLSSMAEKEPKFCPLLHEFVDLDDSTIDFFGIKQVISSWSPGERIMIDLAAHLFNEVHKFNLSDLDYLDERNIKVAIKSIELRFMK